MAFCQPTLLLNFFGFIRKKHKNIFSLFIELKSNLASFGDLRTVILIAIVCIKFYFQGRIEADIIPYL